MAESSNSSDGSFDDPGAVAVSGKIMVGGIILLFLVVVFVFLLHVFAKRFWESRIDSRSHLRRFVFSPSPNGASRRLHGGVGLKPSVIQALPVLVFHSDEFVDGLECSVCLCELSDGEKVRLLPKCNHGFHVDCIDMWFHSHSTCPLCRVPVALESSNPVSDLPPEEFHIPISTTTDYSLSTKSMNFPTNVLFCGNQTQVTISGSCPEDGPTSSSSSSTPPPAISKQGKETLAIEIPRRLNEGFSSVSPSPVESMSPMTRQLRSLQRILSKGKRVIPCSPSWIVDVEQGEKVMKVETQTASVSDS
ncbi:RING-H2 finger protein ATL3 [Telopea speciosissima]|uniref:RING-H2 finger protein ATL3 n=1 Tax=Telopea speciosissima TaxID=54955 RepID=UPI001CC818AF|nr:RING-H2 finger protein ATL3 [Telopea speciosissima]